MKSYRRVADILIISIILVIVLLCYSTETASTVFNTATRSPVNVGVLLYSFDDIYSNLIKQNLEEIQKENTNKVTFTFYDGKGSIAGENEAINNLISKNYDLILANLVDRRDQSIIENFVNEVKRKNIPLILFNSTPIDVNKIKSYQKSVVISLDVKESGVLQGKIIADVWNTDKQTIDRNGDNIMQYIMLQGRPDTLGAIERTKNSISTINKEGIKTEEIASVSCNWDKDLAKETIESLFYKYDGKIEVIIANNDAMAIGAIEALQKFGYNTGDKSKYIPIFGIDAIPEARKLVKQGIMAGTVIQDPRALAEALYNVGMNLVLNKEPLEDTKYKFDETGVRIFLQGKEFTAKSSS